jgi:hypothetical protein
MRSSAMPDGPDQCHSAAHVFAAGPLRATRISVALMIDRADDGVGASRQGRHDDEHQREFTHLGTITTRDRAGHHTRARLRRPRRCPN